MMPKSETIAAIMDLNPTARPSFLAEFSNNELGDYLHRLARPEECLVDSESEPTPPRSSCTAPTLHVGDVTIPAFVAK